MIMLDCAGILFGGIEADARVVTAGRFKLKMVTPVFNKYKIQTMNEKPPEPPAPGTKGR